MLHPSSIALLLSYGKKRARILYRARRRMEDLGSKTARPRVCCTPTRTPNRRTTSLCYLRAKNSKTVPLPFVALSLSFSFLLAASLRQHLIKRIHHVQYLACVITSSNTRGPHIRWPRPSFPCVHSPTSFGGSRYMYSSVHVRRKLLR